jgi:aryl-alcohol dehydrogenase-like predicted oxidoreductase
MSEHIPHRQLGNSAFQVSPIALGCWPIAGMSTGPVDPQTAIETVKTCFETGVNFLDTAYCYGINGESEIAIAQALGQHRAEFVIASKGGIAWELPRQQIIDGRPATLHAHCAESLRRLQTDWIDLYYLHGPDPKIPITESAGALLELMQQGKIRSVGVSNVTLAQLQAFETVCPVTAIQPPYNMLMRDIERDLIPYCQARQIAVVVYWPLLKGLLAGRLTRTDVLPADDSRAKYPMFQGDEYQRNHDLLDELRLIAGELGRTVAELVLQWTIQQPGITAALVGAKSPAQARDNSRALHGSLDALTLAKIDAALQRRGPAIAKRPV